MSSMVIVPLYILRFLHQTTTIIISYYGSKGCISCVFYIKPQLVSNLQQKQVSCISCVFYIKPQLQSSFVFMYMVVYLAFSTSNHNYSIRDDCLLWLYILRFLHQTTTSNSFLPSMPIVVYLAFSTSNHNGGCSEYRRHLVVYLAFSTSNHNCNLTALATSRVVYLAFSTSNHNCKVVRNLDVNVVYLAFSTSNHN